MTICMNSRKIFGPLKASLIACLAVLVSLLILGVAAQAHAKPKAKSRKVS